MENFDIFTEICGENLERIDALFDLPENGAGLSGRAIHALKDSWPDGYGEYVRICRRIMRDESWGFVYIIKGTHKGVERFKIGKANDMNDRLKVFNVKLPFDIETLVAFLVPEPLAFERQLHILMGDKRIAGEWFDLDSRDIRKLLLTGAAEEFAGWAKVSERIMEASRKGARMPAPDYIEYLESILVMNAVQFEKKEPTYD